MQILIVTPNVAGVRTGNISSAEQWKWIMGELSHRVEIAAEFRAGDFDWLIVLHAVKGARAVADCRRQCPKTRIAVVLTGTDIYPEPSAVALETMAAADRLVGIQPAAAEMITAELRHKLRVIVQSSTGCGVPVKKTFAPFEVCVVGHLRDVKDPMLTAAAARLLPEGSQIQVSHAGAILDPKYEALVEAEQRENPRYKWLGQLDADAVRELICASQLLVLSSISEGAGRVVGSAIAKGTPVLSTRIHGVVGAGGRRLPRAVPGRRCGRTGTVARAGRGRRPVP